MNKGGSISSAANKAHIEQISPSVVLVSEQIPKFYSFSLGIFINCGSRDEAKATNGITHLIEHMLFKGTSQKSSFEIVKYIEGLGGSFDAYTTKENLIIITRFLSEHLADVFNLITELLLESKFDEKDMEKEKSVILEEIKTNDEDPADFVFDLFFKALFPDHTMGMPIAGNKQTLGTMDAAQAKAHYDTILKKKLIIAACGNYNHNKLKDLALQKFGEKAIAEEQRTPPYGARGTTLIQTKKEISQVHCVFGVPGMPYTSPLRYQFSILNSAFGGGMSSRLFQGLREQEGLVYNVQSFVDLYSDCGVSGFYFTCDKKNLVGVAKQLKTIFNDLNTNGFGKDETELAKTYLSGNLLLSLESSTNRMLRFGREMTNLGKVNTIDTIIQNIREIKVEDLNRLRADYLDPRNYVIAAVGPVTETEINDIFRIF